MQVNVSLILNYALLNATLDRITVSRMAGGISSEIKVNNIVQVASKISTV